MKKLWIIILMAILFIACPSYDDLDDWEYDPGPYITFEEVSQQYLDQYGQPEDVYEYISDDYHSIDWWWWSKGFMVCFVESTYDDVYGWTVDHTYSFDPF